ILDLDADRWGRAAGHLFGGSSGLARATSIGAPAGLAFVPPDTLLVSQTGSDSIVAVSLTDPLAPHQWTLAAFSSPTPALGGVIGLTASGEHLWMADTERHVVRRMTLGSSVADVIVGTLDVPGSLGNNVIAD